MTKIHLSKKQARELGLETAKKYPTPFERLQKSIQIMENNGEKDTIFFYPENKVCIIEIVNMKLISNNDLLRNDNRKIMKFKHLWHKRIDTLVKNKYDAKWDDLKNNPIIIECLYKTSRNRFMDPDAIAAAFKSPLDGLVESGLLIDDKVKNVPLIIPRQEKNDKPYDSLIIVLSQMEEIEAYYTNFFKNVIKTDV